jgi:hypothetical protein
MASVRRIGVAAVAMALLAGACSSGTSPSPQPAQRVVLIGTVYAAASSRVIQDVRVQIVDGANAGRETLTNGAGHYEFADLMPGTMTLQFSSSGYLDLRRTELIRADTTLEVRLDRGPEPGVVLSGVVTTRWGAPIDDVGVEAVHDGRMFGGGTTNRSGAYSIPTLPVQDYIVRAIKFGYRTPQLPITLTANATLDIALDRVRIEVAGVVEEAPPCSGVIAGARVEIVDGPDAGLSATSTDAGFRIEHVNWGRFTLRVSKAGYTSAEASIDSQPPGSGNPPAPIRVQVNVPLKRTTTGC